MSGHSKWSTIKRQKAVNDAKKGAAFTKLAREIIVAAKVGGGNPDANFRLRLAIQKAKESNMPNANIDRAIKRGTGESGEGNSYEELFYEGYGPGGVAVLLEIMTDNRNRASSSIRHLFSSHGGNLGETGCVAWIFEPRGMLSVQGNPDEDNETIMLELIDAGAEDVEEDEGNFVVYTSIDTLQSVKDALLTAGYTLLNEELTRIPQNTVTIDDPSTAKQLMHLLDALEENDDVQRVYANVEFAEGVV